VRDSAHVIQGACGKHVSKIQRALWVLDGALINSQELVATTYGKTTAAAVLDYKRVRKIINFAYERTADNIVGKMTIDALDREMVEAERPSRWRPYCTDPVRSGIAAPASAPIPIETSQVQENAPPITATLAAIFQLVRVNDTLGPHSFELWRKLPSRADELLAPHGMRVAAIAGFSFSIPQRVDHKDSSDMQALRKAAEKAMPGVPRFLRVIVCPFGTPSHDDTFTAGTSQGEQTDVKGFDNFAVLNANTIRADHGTLLHEMIHCSSPTRMVDTSDHGPNAPDPRAFFPMVKIERDYLLDMRHSFVQHFLPFESNKASDFERSRPVQANSTILASASLRLLHRRRPVRRAPLPRSYAKSP
jgi:hypothetical protein